MLWPQNVRRVVIAEHRVDFRRRFDGLLAESYKMGTDPYGGDCIVFMMGNRTQLRVLIGDALGLTMICRRFEGGRLRATFAFARDPKASTITLGELTLLMEGAHFTVHKRVRAWR